MTKVNAEKYLVEHYSALGDISSDFRNTNLYTLAASLVGGQSVLDIGSGMGAFAKVLKERGRDVVGMEPSAGMRKLAADINPDIKVVEEACGKYDTITMLDVLEHTEDDAEEIRKIHSMLNKSGEFVFVVPACPALYGERDKKMGHFRRYTKKGLKELLESNGFRIDSIRYWSMAGFFPYLISEKILKKPLESKSRQQKSAMQKIFNLWFKYIENNFDFGFGLSIIGVARKES